MTNTLQSNLRASIDLSCNQIGEHPIYHFIYGSQLYGTVFAIYGKFNIEPNPDDGSCKVWSIELKLVNYKGMVNMGFTKRKPVPFVDDDGNENIYFGVQGASKRATQTICFNEPIIVTSEPLMLTFKRILYPLKGFKFSLHERLCHGDIEKPLSKPIPHKNNFDSEFYYRNGDEYFYTALRPGMYGFDGVTLKKIAKLNRKKKNEEENPNGDEMDGSDTGKKNRIYFASPRCHQSNIAMTF